MVGSTEEKRDSRSRILKAAVEMVSEDPVTRLSVRSVAARAGVSTGSLRHHFPTQRALQDAVLAAVYDVVAPGDPIHDVSVPPRDRLVDCLAQVLAQGGTGEVAREGWRRAFGTFVESPTEESDAAYRALEQGMSQRVMHWLSVLASEGALPTDGHAPRARFLLTVLNGLSIERALPGVPSTYASEATALRAAVDCVLDPSRQWPSTPGDGT